MTNRADVADKHAEEALLNVGALQGAIFNSANFSNIATDAKGVIQIFNVGAERRSVERRIGDCNYPGFEALVFKAKKTVIESNQTNHHHPKRCAQACRRTIQQGLP